MPEPARPDVLGRWLTASPASRPVLTHLGPDGARIELSAATLANAVAKGSNLFVDELMLEPGEVVAVALPRHWQTPVVVLSAWAAGLTVSLDPPHSGVAATIAGPAPAVSPVGQALAVSLHPWGLPLGAAAPAGWADWSAMARMQPDHADLQWPGPGQPWLIRGGERLDGPALLARARTLADGWSVPDGGRLLSLLDPMGVDGLLAVTVVPAAVGGSTVMADPGSDVSRITAQERNDAVAAPV